MMIELNTHHARERLGRMERHLQEVHLAAVPMFSLLQDEERNFFQALAGRYVRTGATRDSLTQDSADGAIREAHFGEFVFGTAIPYAVYLKRPPILRATAETRALIGQAIMDHVMT